MMMHINAENLEERGEGRGERGEGRGGGGGREAKGLADDGVDPDYRDERNLQ